MSKAARYARRSNAACIKMARELRRLVPAKTNPLGFYWKVGRVFGRQCKPEYGERSIAKFARAAGLNLTIVYQSIRFYRLWPKNKDVRSLTKKGVTWTHIRILVRGDLTDDDRRKLIDDLVKQKLSVRQLKARVRAVADREHAKPLLSRRKKPRKQVASRATRP